jgi:hypothetical protein
MSSDTTFWIHPDGGKHTPHAIYAALSKGRTVDGLKKLPIKEIFSRFKKAFPVFDPAAEIPVIEKGTGGAEVNWSDYHIQLAHAAGMGEPIPSIRQILQKYGCSMYVSASDMLYGPSDKLFDKENAELEARIAAIQKRHLEVSPVFDRWFAAQKLIPDPQTLEKVQQESFDRHRSPSGQGKLVDMLPSVIRDLEAYAAAHPSIENQTSEIKKSQPRPASKLKKGSKSS